MFRCECIYGACPCAPAPAPAAARPAPADRCLDAVPKKRGPKTEVLEELLKRIDGLEKRLEKENSNARKDKTASPPENGEMAIEEEDDDEDGQSMHPESRRGSMRASRGPDLSDSPAPSAAQPSPQLQQMHRKHSIQSQPAPSPTAAAYTPPAPVTDINLMRRLVDVYFERVHGKPYYIFHEESFRRDFADGRAPSHVINAVCAVSVRWVHELGCASGD